MASLLSNEKYSLYFQKVGLMYKRPEVKASLEIILSVFTVTILIFAAIRPTLTNIVSLQKKIEDQEAVNKKADNKIVQLFNAQNQLNTFGGSLALYDAAVPDGFSYVDSAKRVETVARMNNVAINSLSFNGYSLLQGGKIAGDWGTKLTKVSGNNTIPDQISFTVNGSPQSVFAFLRQIESMDRLVSLNSVALTKQTGMSKTSDTLKAAGQLTFYFYSENK